MLRKLGLWLVPPLAAVACGCQEPVKWTIRSELHPDPVKIGEQYVATCTVTGEVGKIGWVTVAPLVAPEFDVTMKDDGEGPDRQAGDGVFSVSGEPPEEAEAGQYEMEFVVYDKNGDVLCVPSFTILDKEGKTVLKEVVPKKGAEDKPGMVEFSSIVIITVE